MIDISVTFRNLESTEALKKYAEEKFNKLKKFFYKKADVHIVFSVEKFRHEADVTIIYQGNIFHAVDSTQDMYSAIDLVFEKMIKQVKRYRDRSKAKNKKRLADHL